MRRLHRVGMHVVTRGNIKPKTCWLGLKVLWGYLPLPVLIHTGGCHVTVPRFVVADAGARWFGNTAYTTLPRLLNHWGWYWPLFGRLLRRVRSKNTDAPEGCIHGDGSNAGVTAAAATAASLSGVVPRLVYNASAAE